VGLTEWPCPACGQAQKEVHENGQAPTRLLCAACQEEADAQGESEAEHARKAKRKA